MYQNCLVNTPKYSKLCMYRYGELTFSYSFFSVWTHKLRFLAKLLHIPKRAKNTYFFESSFTVLKSILNSGENLLEKFLSSVLSALSTNFKARNKAAYSNEKNHY
jgi:hypothetical protein